jgi:uncharacterized protein (DUF2336 family)
MNTNDRSDITKLVKLAKDKSGQARRVLTENISDLFMSSADRLNEQQYALMTDILGKLIAEAETSVRKELAASLAESGQAPAELLRLLANDQIEIARPILEKSNLLANEDLISVIRQRTDEHRLCIAMRARVSTDVSDALVDEGSEDVIEALLNNPDAEISRQAMEYLVAESRRVDRFQEPLLSRHDLPAELAIRMFWWVSAALRRRIVTDYGFNEIELDDAVESATRKVLGGGGVEGSTSRAQSLVARMSAVGELNIKFLISALKQQKVQVFIAGLSELSQVDAQIIWQVFNDKGGESFAILCKAIGVERTDFTTLFLFLAEVREGRKVRSTNILTEMLSFYDLVAKPSAEAVLKFWRRDKAYLDAMEELSHAAG